MKEKGDWHLGATVSDELKNKTLDQNHTKGCKSSNTQTFSKRQKMKKNHHSLCQRKIDTKKQQRIES